MNTCVCNVQIVIVEWNPLPGWESLAETLRPYVIKRDPPQVRIITVPPSFHDKVCIYILMMSYMLYTRGRMCDKRTQKCENCAVQARFHVKPFIIIEARLHV